MLLPIPGRSAKKPLPGPWPDQTPARGRPANKLSIADAIPEFERCRFGPESDRLLQRREMTLCAISDQSALQQNSVFDHPDGDRGKITLNSANSPGTVSTSIEPPCCFTMMS